MVGWRTGVLCAALALSSTTAMARDGAAARAFDGSEIGLGVFRHGADFHPLGSKLVFDLPSLPAGQVYEGQEENGTVDFELLYRSRPLSILLKPRLTGKLQVNTDGRTSFASVGAEWRQPLLRGRLYAQAGLGLAVIDGYSFTPDPFEPGLEAGEARRRYETYLRRTSFGSKVLFNPNASVGLRLDRRWALELAWEHYSHGRVFSETNPGIDNVGIRLVRSLGR